MALSYFTGSEAPRDFRVSSTESDGHYKKCLLCYTVKRNFYCAECIRTGNFVHTSMPYSDRYSEKQGKLLRVKANRKHILDRCERLLAAKLKKDTLLTEAKQSRDKLELLRLAIEQRSINIEEKRKELNEIKTCNNEVSLKLPRYQKRVSSLGKHAQMQRLELQKKVSTYYEQTEALAAMRRARIRQLIKYIFPVYISYDTSDSIEDMEFIGEDIEEEPLKRAQLHIVAPWIDTDGDLTHVQNWNRGSREALGESCGGGVGGGAGSGPAVGGAGSGPAVGGAARTAAALALAAQLAALLAWTLDLRLPHALPLSEYSTCVIPAAGAATGAAAWRARRVSACCVALAARAALPPPAPAPPSPPAPPAPHALVALHSLAVAAASDDPMLGRVESWSSEAVVAAHEAWCDVWVTSREPDVEPHNEPPEHLHWPDTDTDTSEMRSSPRLTPPALHAPAASLVTSAAASIASMWRGWTK